MREVSKIGLISLMFFVASACGKSEFTPDGYISYVNDKKNGYIQTEKIGDIEITAQYRTPEYMAIEDVGTDRLTTEALNKTLGDKKGAHYILLQIADANKKSDPLEQGISDKEHYFLRIGHLVSGIDKDVLLVDGKDTLPCSIHHFERSYHLTHYHTVLFVFERKTEEASDDLKLIYNDHLLGLNKINFVFDKQVAKAPKIIL